MKEFTTADVSPCSAFDGHIYADTSELAYDPPEWMKRGLQETASGYGRKLNSGRKIHFNGRLYRVYVTCFSNAGTAWFTARGKRYSVS
jgi:hypothetical protein